jgi:hypothetical protein
MANQPEAELRYARLIARAWSDPDFKRRLLDEPAGALSDFGVSIPHGIRVRVVENTSDVVHLVLPAKPPGDLSDEQLEEAAGASGHRGSGIF